MHPMVDLRSDTTTRPTPAMRRAIAEAAVGDDVFEDDPSINALQEKAAALLGKEAGLLVPTGTMGNAVAMMTHTTFGDEVLMDAEAHSMLYEVGLPATLAHVLTRQFRSTGGVPCADEIAHSFHAESLHTCRTSLLILENTHNRAGGTIIPLAVMQALYDIARQNGAAVHLDGARLWNAVMASSVSAAEYAANADTVTFCLSKGLGCPVGSVLCGAKDWIAKARRFRKMLGGGMRQAGMLAAAGIYALDHHIARLADDHANARTLAHGIAQTHGATIANPDVPTNMVYFDTTAPAADWVAAFGRHGVLCLPTGKHTIRMVTHLDVDAEDIERAVRAAQEISEELRQN